MKKTLVVVAAAIARNSSKGLELALFQRAAKDHGAGLYEFPGGKVEAGESLHEALIREIQEELGLEIQVKGLAGSNHQLVGERYIDLQVFWVDCAHFDWVLHEHQNAIWVNKDNWKSVSIVPHDLPILGELMEESVPFPSH